VTITELSRANRSIERVCYAISAVLIVSGLFHLGVLLVTGDSWVGPVSWRKPMTFGLSFGLTLAAVVWVASYVPLSRWARTGLLGAFAAACVIEVSLITLQAWRRVPSHFDMETPLDTTISRVLAAGGGVLIIVFAMLTVAALRPAPATAPSMRLAVRAGLLFLDAGLLLGAVMIARGVSQVIAGHQQAAYHAGEALKPGHAVALHGVLVLPALAWLLARTDWPEQRRILAVRIAVAGYAILVVAAVLW
jgi:hypothetical protein